MEREELFRQYGVALDEYRFCVQLNWDREKFFLGLNAAILGGAAGLLSWDAGRDLVLLPVFVVGIAAAVLGTRVLAKGREYVRAARVKVALLEDALGLHARVGESRDPLATYAVGTTAGMREVAEIKAGPTAWVAKPMKRTTVGYAVNATFWILAALHFVGAVVVALAA